MERFIYWIVNFSGTINVLPSYLYDALSPHGALIPATYFTVTAQDMEDGLSEGDPEERCSA